MELPWLKMWLTDTYVSDFFVSLFSCYHRSEHYIAVSINDLHLCVCRGILETYEWSRIFFCSEIYRDSIRYLLHFSRTQTTSIKLHQLFRNKCRLSKSECIFSHLTILCSEYISRIYIGNIASGFVSYATILVRCFDVLIGWQVIASEDRTSRGRLQSDVITFHEK